MLNKNQTNTIKIKNKKKFKKKNLIHNLNIMIKILYLKAMKKGSYMKFFLI